jgi:transposase
MNCKFTKLTEVEIEKCILPFIPKNKRGFSSKVKPSYVIRCIIHKLKTGCQWNTLFIDGIEFEAICSWQLIYYYYRRWSKLGVFKLMFDTILSIQQDKLDVENLNLDGTHTLAKKAGQSVNYQPRKRGQTSNTLILTDGRGIPLAIGNILSGNHNDLYEVVPQLSVMIKDLKQQDICLDNSVLNADKGFDGKHFRKYCHQKKILPNIKENTRSRKKIKRGRKRKFYSHLYQRRFVNERTFAWIDSFRTLLIRFDTTVLSWLNWHYIAFVLILLKV